MKKKLGFFLLVIIIFAIGINYYINYYIDISLRPVNSNDDKKIIVEIPEGSSTNNIAEILLDNKLIQNPKIFKYYAKKTNSDIKLKAGNYILSRNMSVDELLEVLIKGGTTGNTVDITIIEGLTIEKTAQTISEQLGLNYELMLDLMNNADYFSEDYQFLIDNPEVKSLQGYLMPETYNVYMKSDEETVIRVMLSQFDDFYKEDIMPLLSNSSLSILDVINLASIVEKEAVLDEERDVVAATFLNRLDVNMKLQSCATVNYARGEWKERLTNEDISIDSPFNTYIIEGLPPGPINSPGKNSILAVLDPADVDYLFFVAKGDGSHYFSNNYEDHLAAKNKYLN
ncbi:UPF0755 protein [Sedimentibacter acidaminivorans]|uniref:Endolytic murein transglycosylase n=1 Tax=Sedimentibacter acidaminivorans TaxID=913099 RepID=A0ABS4GBC0_9FIRM|nr:endolytic transglycosylase MltG [Sedimentibacter acidaminivorans]MBP1924983.1 UPF0755 protein [Sedimentibacter acidaminivorans]